MFDRFAYLLFAGFFLSTTPAVAGDSKTRAIVDPKEIGERTNEFERSLTDFGLAGPLKCSLMVEVLGDAGGRDQSFGGICDIRLPNKKPTTIMLCNDTMIGKLTIKAYGFGEDRGELVDFTAANCPAGG